MLSNIILKTIVVPKHKRNSKRFQELTTKSLIRNKLMIMEKIFQLKVCSKISPRKSRIWAKPQKLRHQSNLRKVVRFSKRTQNSRATRNRTLYKELSCIQNRVIMSMWMGRRNYMSIRPIRRAVRLLRWKEWRKVDLMAQLRWLRHLMTALRSRTRSLLWEKMINKNNNKLANDLWLFEHF